MTTTTDIVLPDDVWYLIKSFTMYSRKAYASKQLLKWSCNKGVFAWWCCYTITHYMEKEVLNVPVDIVYTPCIKYDHNLSYYYARLQSIVFRSKVAYADKTSEEMPTHYWKVALMDIDERWYCSYDYDAWSESMVLLDDNTMEPRRHMDSN